MRTLRPFALSLSFALTFLTGMAGAADYIPGSGWQQLTFTSGQNPIFDDEGRFNFTVRAEQHPTLVLEDLDTATENYSVYDYLQSP